MLYPTELRAHLKFLNQLREENWAAPSSSVPRLVLLEVSVNLLTGLSQVSVLDRIVALLHFLRLHSTFPCLFGFSAVLEAQRVGRSAKSVSASVHGWQSRRTG